MNKLRIGVVGLGGIAQKAWLPVLGSSADWTLQGAFSPSREKALRVCETWRIPYYKGFPEQSTPVFNFCLFINERQGIRLRYYKRSC